MAVGGRSTCRKISMTALCELIRPGDRIFISSGAVTPLKTISMLMESNHGNLSDLEIMQLVIPEIVIPVQNRHPHKYRWRTFNVGEAIAQGIARGNVDFIPSTLAEIPYLFYAGALNINVAIIQTSLPDRNGFVNLGVAADVADLAIKYVPLAIAEMNPHVPITQGETFVHIDQFAACVESDLPLIEKIAAPYDDITDRIGGNVATLIEDDSTLALGVGGAFNAIADRLKSKKNLRICSHTLSDWVIGLIDSGALAVDRGMDRRGIIMASYCLGSSRLYDFVSRNPFIEMVPLFRASYQAALPRIPRLVSIIHAGRVDMTGNAIAPEPDDCLYPGFEGNLAFSLASSLSRRGKSIVAVRSLDSSGESNIVLAHNSREEVRSAMGTTRHVVTEYGIANLAGKSIRERALAIIDIAHPDHRDALIKQAKERGYIYGDQIYVTPCATNYPFSLETVKTFGEDLEVRFRPIKPSDEDMMRRLFYGFSDESKFLRYFTPIRTMSHVAMQPYVNIDYQEVLSVVGTILDKGSERIIAEARYAHAEKADSWEMAFVVDEGYQGRGIASFLLDYLIGVARERGVGKLSAFVMTKNTKMAKVFKSARIKPKVRTEGEEVEFLFDLAAKSGDAAAPPGPGVPNMALPKGHGQGPHRRPLPHPGACLVRQHPAWGVR